MNRSVHFSGQLRAHANGASQQHQPDDDRRNEDEEHGFAAYQHSNLIHILSLAGGLDGVRVELAG
jgi:hypothetical protein